MSSEQQKESGMDYVARLTDDVISRFNKDNVRCAMVVIRNGIITTKKTDNFESISEYIGIWEAAKFQDMVALWKLQSKVSQRYSGESLGD